TAHAQHLEAERANASIGRPPFPGDHHEGRRAAGQRIEHWTAVADEGMLQSALAPRFAVDPHRIAGAAVNQLKRTDGQRAEAPELEGGAAPGVSEAVEAFLKERERREDAAALQALDDLLVEQRIDLAQGLAGTLTVVGADEGEAGGGQGPEALETVVLRGSGSGGQEDRRQKKHEPPALAIHRAMLQQSRETTAARGARPLHHARAGVAVRARRHAVHVL